MFLALMAALVFGQVPPQQTKPATAPKTGEFALDSGPGSFRVEGEGHLVLDILGGDDPRDAGTLYISGLKGERTVTGMRLEYKDGARECYHGIGHVDINGKFRAINFLGSGVKGSFTGYGMFRLYGDLDKNLRTGLFWYPGLKDAKGKQVVENWDTNGRQVDVPRPPDYEARPKSDKAAQSAD
jgi:hypothetical protein